MLSSTLARFPRPPASPDLLVILPRLDQVSVVVINVADIIERRGDAGLIAQAAEYGESILVGLAGFGEISLIIEQVPD